MWQFWPFLSKFGPKWIFLEKRLCQFLNITIMPEIRKKLICHSWGKCWIDGWMDRQTTRSLLDPLLDGGPIIKVTLSFPEFKSKHEKPVYSINFFVRYSSFRILEPEWAYPFITTPIPISFDQLLISMNLNQHAKYQAFSYFRSRDIIYLKILQSDWPKYFDTYLRNQTFPRFFQTYSS